MANPARTELEAIAAEQRAEELRTRPSTKPNAYVSEFLRISRKEHYAKEALAGELLAALEGIIDYAEEYVANYHEAMAGYRISTHLALDADMARAIAAIEKFRGQA